MHRNYVCWVRFQPAYKLFVSGHIECLVAGMAFMIPIVIQTVAVFPRLLAPNEIYFETICFELFSYPGSPAAVIGYGVSVWHISDFGLRKREVGGGEGENCCEFDHFRDGLNRRELPASGVVFSSL